MTVTPSADMTVCGEERTVPLGPNWDQSIESVRPAGLVMPPALAGAMAESAAAPTAIRMDVATAGREPWNFIPFPLKCELRTNRMFTAAERLHS